MNKMKQFFVALSLGALFSTSLAFYAFTPKEIYPVVHLNGKVTGDFNAKDFSSIQTLSIKDGDESCQITSYLMYYMQPSLDPVEFKGNQALFTGGIKRATQNAAEGHKYIFTNIELECQGSQEPKEVNSLSFTIR